MVSGVAENVEIGVETARQQPALRIRLLGPLRVLRGDEAVELPASRKLRGLLAYLALSPRAVTRAQLCELLWDLPSDPRGELRTALSKLRRLLDTPHRTRVVAQGESVRLDLADCAVDALDVEHALTHGVATLDAPRAIALAGLFEGDLLEGLEVERSPAFSAWLVASRRRCRELHLTLLAHLANALNDEACIPYVEQWLSLAPFEPRAHQRLLSTLAARGRLRDGDEHVEAAAKRFADEGVDFAPVRLAWQAVRAQSRERMSAPRRSVEHVEPLVNAAAQSPADPARRASIAIMPFRDLASAAQCDGLADALAHDVITRLAKLRNLFVIAQGSVFALKERGVGPQEAGRLLGVDYLVSGILRADAGRLIVEVELAQAASGRVVWADRFTGRRGDALSVLDDIGNGIVACIESEIERIERNRAILRPPNSLDAWEAHHRGLWHMYRFTQADNEAARHFFERAVALDPTFARAYAGLSFTHWQSAFQGWSPREPEIDRALDAAGHGMMIDDRDPAVHWAHGRALWLRGQHTQAVIELEQSVELSPNFAQGHYSLAFVQSQAGDPRAAIVASDKSRRLSPFDPLLFGMLGARAIAMVRLGQFEQAADAALQAAARPNAHPHIYAIAAFALALAGRDAEAASHAAAIHRMVPDYTVEHFLHAFRLDGEGEARFRQGARRVSMAG